MRRDDLPTEFTLRDERGRIWPPGFVSELCRHGGPHSMLGTSALAMSAAGQRGRENSAMASKGWGNGTIETIARPGYTRAMPPQMMKKPRDSVDQSDRQRAFVFKSGSFAKSVHHRLQWSGDRMTDVQLAVGTKLNTSEVRAALAPAVAAGLIKAEATQGTQSGRTYWVESHST
jgi:hypothetical protein